MISDRPDAPQLTVRASPFVFLKRLVVVELLFALLPLALIGIAQARADYESLEVSRTYSYDFLVAILLTTVQVFILVALFVAWYVQAYQIDGERVIQRRGGLGMDRQLAATDTILRVERRQGALGRRFDYATLEIITSEADKPVSLRDVPAPRQLQSFLENLATVRQLHMAELPPDEAPLRPLVPLGLPRPDSAAALVAAGEGQYVEFKASLQWDYRLQRVNKELYEPVMKNLVAFMNSEGGYLLIGVSDEGEVLGLDADFRSMQKGNPDGFENKFNVTFNTMVGAEYRRFVEASFPEIDGKLICLLAVRPADEPVYLRHKGEESFYIRAGNGSQPLPVSKAARYIQSRFGG